jgi:hypothetical protein
MFDNYTRLAKRKKVFNERLRRHIVNVANEHKIIDFSGIPLSYYWCRVLDDSESKYYKECLSLLSYCIVCFKKHTQRYFAEKCCAEVKDK